LKKAEVLKAPRWLVTACRSATADNGKGEDEVMEPKSPFSKDRLNLFKDTCLRQTKDPVILCPFKRFTVCPGKVWRREKSKLLGAPALITKKKKKG